MLCFRFLPAVSRVNLLVITVLYTICVGPSLIVGCCLLQQMELQGHFAISII